MVDGLAVMMLFVVTVISLLVHVIQQTTYQETEDIPIILRSLILSVHAFSLSLAKISSKPSSVRTRACGALIGHWWEEPNSDAALKAF